MYGLAADTDLSFLSAASLIQVCVGENETILHLHPRTSIMIASSVRLVAPSEEQTSLDQSLAIGAALLPLLGSHVTAVSVLPPGTLRLAWSSQYVLDILDSYEQFESYTVTNGSTVIVV